MSVEDRSWMYHGWKDNGCHSQEWNVPIELDEGELSWVFTCVKEDLCLGILYGLNTERYKIKAVELNGPQFDWLHSPVDARALYQCSCGCRHGKWALFNGVIDDNEALPVLRSSHGNAAAARRQRQEEEELLRKEAHDGCAAKEYAQSMFEWGATVHAYCGNMQKFMEQVACHNGMPVTAVPSPPAPPPLPPAYVAASSQNPSLVNVGTFGSPVQTETPEETLSRIAYGGYPCHVSATSGGAPEDDFPML